MPESFPVPHAQSMAAYRYERSRTSVTRVNTVDRPTTMSQPDRVKRVSAPRINHERHDR